MAGSRRGMVRKRASLAVLASAAVASLLAYLNQGVGVVPAAVSAGMPVVLGVAVIAAVAGWPHAILGRLSLVVVAVVPHLEPLLDADEYGPAYKLVNPFTVASLNTLGGSADPRAVARLAMDADVLALYEVTDALEAPLLRGLGAEWAVAFDGYDGQLRGSTLVLVRSDTTVLGSGQLAGAPTPTALLRLSHDGDEVRVVATRLSNPVLQSSRDWGAGFAAIEAELRLPTTSTVVVGDFNATPWHVRYRSFVDDSGLADCSVPATSSLTGTWGPSVGRDWYPLAIDHLMVSGGVCSDYRLPEVAGTDHKAVVATVGLPGAGGSG